MSFESSKTNVYLTVDVECAEERPGSKGHRPSLDTDLRIFGNLQNQATPQGIGWIMDILDNHKLPGVFFVEALSSEFYGIDPLKRVCTTILGRGHDVQLHLHPVLRNPNWISSGAKEVEDDIGAYSEEEQLALLSEGIDKLVSAGVKRDELVGFRAGNYGADNRTWKAMSSLGLRVSSNYNPNYVGDSCHIKWPNQAADLFEADNGVLELPISNFREGEKFRHLQITAVTTEELENFLWEARKNNIGHVTIVTHSFEFFHLDDAAKRKGRPNRINQWRWKRLCEFLAKNQKDFSVQTVKGLAQANSSNPISPKPEATFPVSPPRARARRLAEQIYKRLEARIPI